MTEILLENIPDFTNSISSVDSVQSARTKMIKNNSNLFLVEENKEIIGFITTDDLFCEFPNRLIIDLPIKEIQILPDMSCVDLYRIMQEKQIPIVGILKDDQTFFFTLTDLINYMSKQALMSLELMEKHYPVLVQKLINNFQHLLVELDLLQEEMKSESNYKHTDLPSFFASNIYYSISYFFTLHKMGFDQNKPEDRDLMSSIEEIYQSFNSLFPDIEIEIDDSIIKNKPKIHCDNYLSEIILAVNLLIINNCTFPGLLNIKLSHEQREGYNYLIFESPLFKKSYESYSKSDNADQNFTSINDLSNIDKTPISLFLDKVLERNSGSIEIINDNNGNQTITVKLPVKCNQNSSN